MFFLKQPQIFISHRHAYGEDYQSLVRRLWEWGIEFKDGSWPEGATGDSWWGKRHLRERIRGSIRWCNVFIVVGRMATAHSHYCQLEVEIADAVGKPILVYRPPGTTAVPRFIRDAENYRDEFTQMPRLLRLLEEILNR